MWAISPIERRIVMDKFDVVFAAMVAAGLSLIMAALVYEVVTSPDVVVVGADETVNEID
jgi:hypothetical protein